MVRKRSVAERIAESLTAPTSVDPADIDGLDDETAAGSRKARSAAAPEPASLGPPEKRLRLRAGIPEISKYKGTKVDRREVFGGGAGEEDDDLDASEGEMEPFPTGPPSDDDGDDADIAPAGGGAGAAPAGNFSISSKLEAEYERMMKQTSKQLEVMRAPSAAEVTKRQGEAKRLKRQLEAWNALVEFRIHLEGALSLGHRLPVGGASVELHKASSEAASDTKVAGDELQGLLAELLALQGRLADQESLRTEIAQAQRAVPRSTDEAGVWGVVDGCLRRVLDWSIGEADTWKDRTQLDARKSFKVLDQSLRLQMQAFSEMPAEKARRRCTPPPGRHQVFGIAAGGGDAGGATASGGQEGVAGGEAEIYDDRDFYVQLLREVLGAGGAGGKAGALGEEAKELQLELQGRRAAKRRARADVERRASKGRKIRYVPIEKLQNFMAPRRRDAAAAVAAGALLGGRSILGVEAGSDLAVPAQLQEGAMDALLRSLFA